MNKNEVFGNGQAGVDRAYHECNPSEHGADDIRQ